MGNKKKWYIISDFEAASAPQHICLECSASWKNASNQIGDRKERERDEIIWWISSVTHWRLLMDLGYFSKTNERHVVSRLSRRSQLSDRQEVHWWEKNLSHIRLLPILVWCAEGQSAFAEVKYQYLQHLIDETQNKLTLVAPLIISTPNAAIQSL